MYVTELRDLITDLRCYLGETLCREKLSPRAEEERLKLLARLGPQPPAYLEMVKATTLPGGLKGSLDGVNGYERLSESPSPCKSGSLSRRERFLFLEASRKVWARLAGSELYLHQPAKLAAETRPASHVIPLDGYTARRAVGPGHGKPFTFEIVCPGKKTYQFTATSEDDMDSWIEALTEAGQRCRRELPVPPASPPQEVYDTPDSRVRPVTPPQEYESMEIHPFYQVIHDKSPHRLIQEQLYKNVGNLKEEDACYYNLITTRDTEEIYQTITEADKVGAGQSRIQAIIKAMEASIAEAQLYEPVESTQER